MTFPKFHSYPKEWGMQLHHTGPKLDLQEEDLKTLDLLREHFKGRRGEILSWKFDLAPIVKERQFIGLQAALMRLWKNGLVVRFAQQFFTKHDQRPEYIQWYIWEESDEGSDLERGDPRAAHYIV